MTHLTASSHARTTQTWLTCSACHHSWPGIVLPTDMRDAARALAQVTCPKCGVGSDRIRMSNIDPRVIQKA